MKLPHHCPRWGDIKYYHPVGLYDQEHPNGSLEREYGKKE